MLRWIFGVPGLPRRVSGVASWDLRSPQRLASQREALRSRYRAKLDGVPVELLFLVLKKDQCVYDFTYVAPLGRYEERLAGFESWVHGFHAEDAS